MVNSSPTSATILGNFRKMTTWTAFSEVLQRWLASQRTVGGTWTKSLPLADAFSLHFFATHHRHHPKPPTENRTCDEKCLPWFGLKAIEFRLVGFHGSIKEQQRQQYQANVLNVDRERVCRVAPKRRPRRAGFSSWCTWCMCGTGQRLAVQ